MGINFSSHILFTYRTKLNGMKIIITMSKLWHLRLSPAIPDIEFAVVKAEIMSWVGNN